jgi:hypothetical protein
MKQPNCKICKKPFQRFRTTQTVCGHDCAKTEGERKQAEKKRQQDALDKVQRLEQETLPQVKAKLQTKINELARLIDYGLPCIATGDKATDGGHFRSVGSHDSIRFNLHNIHRQSRGSNGFKGGAQIDYIHGIENEYGKEYRDFIEYDLRQTPVQNWTKEQLRQAMKDCNEIKRWLLNVIKAQPISTPAQRIARRNEVNCWLGLYEGRNFII